MVTFFKQQVLHFDLEVTKELAAKLNRLFSSPETALLVIFGKLFSTYLQSNTIYFAVKRNNEITRLDFSYDENTLVHEAISDTPSKLNFEERIIYSNLQSAINECLFIIEPYFQTDALEEERVICRIHYRNKDIHGVPIVEIFKRFKIVLENSDPSIKVKDLSLLTQEEKKEVLADFYVPQNYFKQTLHQMIELQVQKTPEGVALIDGTDSKKTLTYLDLNQRSNQLANYLRNCLKIKEKSVIAICLQPSFEMIIATIAVWKIGCVVMFIDPKVPTLRLKEQLEESKASVFLTTSKNQEKLKPSIILSAILDIELDQPKILKENASNLMLAIDSEFPATLFFTSGSTGKPNGVLNGHRQFVNSILDMQKRFYVDQTSRVLLLTNCIFDPVLTEIVLPLVLGAVSVVIPRAVVENPILLQQAIDNNGITLMQLTPTMLQLLTDDGWQLPDTLKVLCGGESLRLGIAEKFKNLGLRYGTTETTTYSTEYNLNDIKEPYYSGLIGWPINNTQMVTLDQNGQLAPFGEIYIGGAGVAIGYLDSEQTDQVFLESPFIASPGKLYRTRDLGSRLPDGSFIFHGRIAGDNQFKIHSVRINAEQIEGVFERFALSSGEKPILQCIVVPYYKQDGEKFPVANIVLKNSQEKLDIEALFQHVTSFFPSFIMPRIRVLIELPFLPNGKVDREKIKNEIQKKSAMLLFEYNPLKTITLKGLAGVCGKIFGMLFSELDYDAHFFEHLRGDSLKAVGVINGLRKYFPSLRYTDFYRYPTIRKLFSRIQELEKETHHPDASLIALFPAEQEGGQKSYPLSYSQADVVFAYQLSPAAYNSYVVLEFEEIDTVALRKTIYFLIERHEILRTSIVNNLVGIPIQEVFSFSDILACLPEIGVIDVSRFSEDELKKMISAEVHQPFDLKGDLPFKFRLFQQRVNRFFLVLCYPHTHIDGQSEKILCHQLLLIYDAFKNNRDNPLPNDKVQFYYYAEWQRKLFETKPPFLNNQLEQLERDFQDLPELEIYSENSFQAAGYDGKQLCFNISEALKKQCIEFANSHDGTLFTVICSAYFVLLSRYSGQLDLAIGTAASGRAVFGFDQCLGQFATLVILAIKEKDLSSGCSFEMMHKIICEKLHIALDSQIIPYSKQLEIIKQLGRKPPQIMLAFLDEFTIPEDMQVRIDPFFIESRQAKYPIALYVQVRKDGIECAVEFKTALYEEAFMQQFLNHFQQILFQVMKPNYSQMAIKEVSFLSEDEMKKLADVGVGEIVEIPENQSTVVKAFEKSLNLYSQHIALQKKQETMTYEELNRKVDEFVEVFQQLGISPMPVGQEKVVAVCTERSFDHYICFFAVLKAGGCFLALSPGLPPERAKYMLKDSDATLFVGDKKYGGELENELLSGFTLPLVLLDSGKLTVVNGEKLVVGEKASYSIVPESAAYLIYTSGSTGQPKGTVLTHAGTVNIAYATYRQFDIRGNDRFFAWAAYTFDASVWETFSALLFGAMLCIPEQGDILSGEILSQYLLSFAITVTLLPPSVLKTIKNDAELFEHLRIIFSGGESCGAEIIKKWGKNRIFCHAFGLTEAHVIQAWKKYENTVIDATRPPVGRSPQNVSLFLLDQNQCLVPMNVPGELYVTGNTCLARGHTKKDQTDQAFVMLQAPFSSSKRIIRALRTFDECLWNSDGELVYIKRQGTEIKVSDIRVDIEGIKLLILNSQLVDDAVIYVWKNPKNIYDIRIFACVLLKEEDKKHGDGAVEKLMAEFSRYIQSSVVDKITVFPIKTIPLTRHGKIDYSLIGKWIEKQHIEREPTNNPPQTETEKKLAKIWAEIAEVECDIISREDKFLEFGIDSHKRIELLSKINEKFSAYGIKLSQDNLIENPRLTFLAKLIESKKPEKSFGIMGLSKKSKKAKTNKPKTTKRSVFLKKK